jgi:hypothetical protein
MAADGEGERGRQGDLESGARKKQHLAEVATRTFNLPYVEN